MGQLWYPEKAGLFKGSLNHKEKCGQTLVQIAALKKNDREGQGGKIRIRHSEIISTHCGYDEHQRRKMK